jgi:hypothetical protein
VKIVAAVPCSEHDRIHLETFDGYIARSRLSDEEWVHMTSDYSHAAEEEGER